MKVENIKFRGKSKRTGKWLYGDLVRGVGGECAIVPPLEMSFQYCICDYNVDKVTIGQFTGLYDENEREIYEGDEVIPTRVIWYLIIASEVERLPSQQSRKTDIL